MTTSRVKETVSKYVNGMEYIKNVCGKSGGRIVQQDFRDATKLSAIAIKGMVELGYIKKISRGTYSWNLGDIVEPKAARNVYDYVRSYFKNNAIKRDNIASAIAEAEYVSSINNVEQIVTDISSEITELEIKMSELMMENSNLLKERMELIEKISEMGNTTKQDCEKEYEPYIVCTSDGNEPSSKSYYFLGIPLWSIKYK